MNTKNDTKRKRTASGDAPRLSEERFNCHLELSSEWYWEQDENYRFTLIRGGGFEKTGVDPRQFLGTARWDQGATAVGATWEAHKALLEARQPFADFVYRRVDSQRELRYISASGQPVFDAKKRF